jgi:hypothetical protein
MTQSIPATLIPGDGIGPEIVDATLAVLDALGAPFQWDTQIAGLGGVKEAGDPLPPKTIESIRRTRLALKGPWKRRRAAAIALPMCACAKNSSCTRICALPARSSRAAASTTSISWWCARISKACTSVTSTTSPSTATPTRSPWPPASTPARAAGACWNMLSRMPWRRGARKSPSCTRPIS